jgi:hypothetical protein
MSGKREEVEGEPASESTQLPASASSASGKGESVSGYFRKLFEEHPEWLQLRDNESVYQRYRQDHGVEPNAFAKQMLSMIKSMLRKGEMTKRQGRKNDDDE